MKRCVWHTYPDEKPDETGTYIISFSESGKTRMITAFYFRDGEDFVIPAWYGKIKVEAWTELPEPYKGKDDKEDRC